MNEKIKLETESVRIPEIISEEVWSDTWEDEVNLNAEAVDVIDVESGFSELAIEVTSDGAVLSGYMENKIFYMDEDNNILMDSGRVRINKSFSIPKAKRGMDAMVKLRMINLQHNLYQGNKVNVKADVEIDLRISSLQKYDIATGAKGAPEELDFNYSLLEIEDVSGEKMFNLLEKHLVELPGDISEVFRIVHSIRSLEGKVKKNTVIISGLILKDLFYRTSNGAIGVKTEEIPLEKELSFPGCQSGEKVDLNLSIMGKDFGFSSEYIGHLYQDVSLCLGVKVYGVKRLNVITDVSGPGIKVEKETLQAHKVISGLELSETFTDTLNLEAEVNEVLKAIGSMQNVDVSTSAEQLSVKGEIDTLVFMIDNNSFFRLQHVSLPVNFQVPAYQLDENKRKVFVNPQQIEEVYVELIEPGLVELQAPARILVKLTEYITEEVITSIEVLDALVDWVDVETKLYIVQPGDTLEIICCRFNVTVEDIIRANPEREDQLNVYSKEKIRIPVFVRGER